MPTNRTKRKPRRRADIMPPQVRLYLLHGVVEGVNPFIVNRRKCPGMDGSTFEQAFRHHEEMLIREYVKDFPGRRPWSWWRWTAKEPRKILAGTGKPELTAITYQGFPLAIHEVQEEDPPMFESQAAYLHRLRLLSEEERKALLPEDFIPAPLDEEARRYVYINEVLNDAD